MGLARFEVNTLVNFDAADWRLVRKLNDTCWHLENTRSLRPLELETNVLLEKYARGHLTFPATEPTARKPAVYLPVPPEEFDAAKVRLLYAQQALAVPNTRSGLEAVATEVWERYRQPRKRPGWISIYRWKKRYLASGKDIRALVSNTAQKGNRTSRKEPEVIEICDQAISKRYLTRERATIETTLNEAINRVRLANSERPAGTELSLPTRRLLTRMVQKLPAFDKYVARYGMKRARHTFRSSLGHRLTEAPLQRAEIDHTLLDVYVIDEKHLLPLGRPYLTVCIDDYSRCVLGIYVGFYHPSYLTVALCLKDCFKPKVSLREEFPEILCAWPSYGIMQQLVTDNAMEFHSKSLEEACLCHGIELHYAASGAPWAKGKIERFIGTLNRGIPHKIPGKTFANIAEKGDYNPLKHACVTLHDLQLLIRKWIADVYHQEIHRTLQATPAATWNAAITPDDIPLSDSPLLLDAFLGAAEQRVLTHKGIEYAGLLYNSPELTELRRLKGDTLKVDIRVDMGNLASIYVLWPGAEPYTVPALLREYTDGLNLYAHKLCKKYRKEHNRDAHDDEALMEAKRAIQKEIDDSFTIRRQKTHKRGARFGESTQHEVHLSVPGEFTDQTFSSRDRTNKSDSTQLSSGHSLHWLDTPDEPDSEDDETLEFVPKRKELS